MPILKMILLTLAWSAEEIAVMDIVHDNNRNYKSMTTILNQLCDSIEMLFAHVPMPCKEIGGLQLRLVTLYKKLRISYY